MDEKFTTMDYRDMIVTCPHPRAIVLSALAAILLAGEGSRSDESSAIHHPHARNGQIESALCVSEILLNLAEKSTKDSGKW